MSKPTIGTQEQWDRARAALLEREDEVSKLAGEVNEQRQTLPWVPVEKTYTFATDEGTKTLAELFDGRSQLLIYHLMFGPDYTGACPGCSGLADHFDGGVVHLNHRDVTLIAMSRTPLHKIQAYKQRMGWHFPWVSAFGSDFNRDFGFEMTGEQMASEELRTMVDKAPDWLREWAVAVGTELKTGLVEGPGWNVFAMADGTVHHTYSRHAPDGDMLVPYHFLLLDQVPAGRGDSFRALRHDEYGQAMAVASS